MALSEGGICCCGTSESDKSEMTVVRSGSSLNFGTGFESESDEIYMGSDSVDRGPGLVPDEGGPLNMESGVVVFNREIGRSRGLRYSWTDSSSSILLSLD